jgi:D-citramalate synthase
MDNDTSRWEQTSGVSLSAAEKLTIAHYYWGIKVDRIEIALHVWVKGNFKGKRNYVLGTRKGYTHRIEVLTLWMADSLLTGWKTEPKFKNLLTKGSLNHHLTSIKRLWTTLCWWKLLKVSALAKRMILKQMYRSNGMRNSPEYVFQYLDSWRNLWKEFYYQIRVR